MFVWCGMFVWYTLFSSYHVKPETSYVDHGGQKYAVLTFVLQNNLNMFVWSGMTGRLSERSLPVHKQAISV
jgi:hypothetical protein